MKKMVTSVLAYLRSSCLRVLQGLASSCSVYSKPVNVNCGLTGSNMALVSLV